MCVLINFLNLKQSNKSKLILCTAYLPYYFLSESVIAAVIAAEKCNFSFTYIDIFSFTYTDFDISKSKVWEAWSWWEIQLSQETNYTLHLDGFFHHNRMQR